MGKKVLVVEDEEFIREVIAASLDDCGFRVDTFADGQSLWQHLKRHNADLVLLDLTLPDTDGLTICRKLRASAATADLPVIVVSAMSQPLTIRAAFEAGANAFIKKPFDLDELIDAVESCMNQPQPSPVPLATPAFNLSPQVRRAG